VSVKKRYDVYSVKSGSRSNSLNVKQIACKGDLGAGYASFSAFIQNRNAYILAFNKAGLYADIYSVKKGIVLTKTATSKMQTGWDIIAPFQLGGKNHLIAYKSSSGLYNFYRIEDNLSLTMVYEYQKTYGDVTSGYTTVAPFSSHGNAYYASYDTNSGRIRFFELSVPPSSPLSVNVIWSHSWAQGWTRFAFFTMGGGNFFLKTNVKYKNVNIDSIMSDPSQGTHEVGTHLPLPLNLDLVVSFAMPGGNPYFATYRKNGKAAFNRINCDCLGWAQEAEINTMKNANAILPFTLGSDNYMLIY
jgi:hypothetical protein